MVDVLYEDRLLIAVHKPAGLASIPGRFDPHCLRTLLEDHLGAPVYVVHRLDKDVSGVLVFARDADTHRYLNTRFETREVEKHYVALVHGTVAERSAVIDRPIRQYGSGRMGVDEARGKPSRTAYTVRRPFTASGSLPEAATLLDVHPVTGRRHQIRVHLYSVGHPIVGDPLYGDRAQQQRYPRLMLHAHTLAFRHPEGHRISFTAPLPAPFAAFVDDLAG